MTFFQSLNELKSMLIGLYIAILSFSGAFFVLGVLFAKGKHINPIVHNNFVKLIIIYFGGLYLL